MLWETWGLGCLESHGCHIGYFSAHFKGVPATKNCGIIQINPGRSCLGKGKIERRGSSLDAAAQKTRRSRTPKSTHSDLTCWDWPDPLQPNFHRTYAYMHKYDICICLCICICTYDISIYVIYALVTFHFEFNIESATVMPALDPTL